MVTLWILSLQILFRISFFHMLEESILKPSKIVFSFLVLANIKCFITILFYMNWQHRRMHMRKSFFIEMDSWIHHMKGGIFFFQKFQPISEVFDVGSENPLDPFCSSHFVQIPSIDSDFSCYKIIVEGNRRKPASAILVKWLISSSSTECQNLHFFTYKIRQEFYAIGSLVAGCKSCQGFQPMGVRSRCRKSSALCASFYNGALCLSVMLQQEHTIIKKFGVDTGTGTYI